MAVAAADSLLEEVVEMAVSRIEEMIDFQAVAEAAKGGKGRARTIAQL